MDGVKGPRSQDQAAGYKTHPGHLRERQELQRRGRLGAGDEQERERKVEQEDKQENIMEKRQPY